jgi:hypothetical protein
MGTTVGATMLWPEHGLRAERGLTENGQIALDCPGDFVKDPFPDGIIFGKNRLFLKDLF